MKSNRRTIRRAHWFLSLGLAFTLSAGLQSCQESLEQRAAREAAEFTQKSCPTPERDNMITDSMTFDIPTHTFVYYYSVTGPADNAANFVGREGPLHEVLANRYVQRRQHPSGIGGYTAWRQQARQDARRLRTNTSAAGRQ